MMKCAKAGCGEEVKGCGYSGLDWHSNCPYFGSTPTDERVKNLQEAIGQWEVIVRQQREEIIKLKELNERLRVGLYCDVR